MAEPFKNLIDETRVGDIAAALTAVWSSFPAASFIEQATTGLDRLELKDRVRHVASALSDALPPPFHAAVDILCKALPTPLPDTDAVSSHFGWWPFLQVVEDRCLEDPDAALNALERMTQTFSGEFAIRPLIAARPEATLARMLDWTTHPNVHVRRLASEGSRPRLPWGQRLTVIVDDPSRTRPILTALRDDPELYVRRSVANHVADIAKDHLDLAVSLMGEWMQDASAEREWVVRHAMRAPLKAGDPGALALLGFHPVEVTDVRVTLSSPVIRLGESVTVQLEAVMQHDGPVMMDLAMTRPTRSGTSRKTFKGLSRSVSSGERVDWQKSLPIREVTTRTWYPGTHRIDVTLNGRVVGGGTFELELEPSTT